MELHHNLMSDDFLLKFGSPSPWLGLQRLELQISHFSVYICDKLEYFSIRISSN